MALIGLLLIAAAAAVGIDLVAQNQFGIDIEVFGQTYATSTSAVFVAGAVAGMAAALGIMLLIDGMSRRRRVRSARRDEVEERERLAAAYVAEHPEVKQYETAPSNGEDMDLRDRIRARESNGDRDRERERITTF